ncbi:MAG: sulfotransferase family protein [Bacillota bacterium]
MIIGAGRGGTSLLAGLLDSHSKLEVGFEKFGVDYLMGKSLRLRFKKGNNLALERANAFKKMCFKEAKKYPKKVWGNKITTEQVLGLMEQLPDDPQKREKVLDYTFNKCLSGIKIVFILRDGRTCIRSKVKRTGQTRELAASRWKFSVEIYKYLNERHSNNIIVRFEDLLLNAENEMINVCEFLGIPFEKQMLEGTKNEKMLPEYQKNGFDLSKRKIDSFCNEVSAMIEEELKFCGYLK